MLRAALIAGCVLGLTSCAATMPPVPGKGGPAWFELTSEHFTVWTDAEVSRAQELVREIERLHQVIVGVAFPGAASDRIVVVALRDDDELRLSPPARAFTISASSELHQPIIFLSVFSNVWDTDVTAAHELSHAISGAVVHRQPRWFAEGLATYFETLSINVDDTAVTIGAAPKDGARPRRMPRLVPASSLFAWGRKEIAASIEHEMYSTAWALFTFLINEHRAELVRYMELLGDVDPAKGAVFAQVDDAWNQAFPF